MGPIVLFEKTMNFINKEEYLKEESEFLNVDEINKGNLLEECEKLHKFLREDLDKDCFPKEFPIAYAFDRWNFNNWKAFGETPSQKEDFLGYEICYNKNDKPPRICNTICCDCSYYKVAKKEAYKYKNELDHFLTRLLFERARNKSDNKVALSGNLEPGLYILAAEVMAKNVQNEEMAKKFIICACNLFYEVVKHGKKSNEVNTSRENIKKELE